MAELKTNKKKPQNDNVKWIDGSMKKLIYQEETGNCECCCGVIIPTAKTQHKQNKTYYTPSPKEDIVIIKEVNKGSKKTNTWI